MGRKGRGERGSSGFTSSYISCGPKKGMEEEGGGRKLERGKEGVGGGGGDSVARRAILRPSLAIRMH